VYDSPGTIGTWALANAKDDKTSGRREKEEPKNAGDHIG